MKELNQEKSECDLCGKSYGGSHALERHKRTVHDGIKDYVCEEGATIGISMRDHIFRMHEGDKSHLITCCNECGKTVSKGFMKKHIQIVHEGNKDLNFKCDLCEKLYSNNSKMEKHKRIVHEDKKDHTCEECGKSFSHLVNCHLLLLDV